MVVETLYMWEWIFYGGGLELCDAELSNKLVIICPHSETVV
jgi:hypothetical protein